MFLIGDNGQQLLNLSYTEYLRQFMVFAGVKGGGNNKRCGVNMFKIKAAGLRYLVTFFTTHAMFFDDITDVVGDVLLADSGGQQIVIMRKEKAHLLCVITDGTDGILLCQQCIVHLLQARLRFRAKCYFAVLIFFA